MAGYTQTATLAAPDPVLLKRETTRFLSFLVNEVVFEPVNELLLSCPELNDTCSASRSEQIERERPAKWAAVLGRHAASAASGFTHF